MTKLDEDTIIKIFQDKFNKKRFTSEDVEFFQLGKIKIVIKIDTFVQSTDIPPKMRLEDAARKSIVACVSDFAAKGVKPEFGIISVNLPKKIKQDKVREIANGFQKASKEFGITILGGDTNSGKEIVFTVCIFGKAKKIVKRQGAKKGDIIIVTGPFGYTSAGLDILLNKKRMKGKFAVKAIQSVLRPKPKIEFGLKNATYFSSSMDSSDGLSTTLNEMAAQSKKRFIIENAPHSKETEQYAESQKLKLNNLVFNGGEEYEIVFTISPKYLETVRKNAKILKTPIIEIGHVESGKGVCLNRNNDQIEIIDRGWKHFR